MREIAPKPQWGKWIGGSALLALAIAAGGASLAINVIFGLQQSVMTGVVYGMADAGKILLLVCCTLIGWTMRERAILIVCVLLSVYCATRYWLDTQGQEMMQRQGQQQAWTGAQADLGRIRGDLVRITETGDAAALTAQADAAKARADSWKAKAEEEAATGRGKRWQAANEAWTNAVKEEATLRGQAGQARRRDELQAELKAVKSAAVASGGPAELSGLSSAVALGGIDAEKAERINHLIVTVMLIAMAEMLTWLAIPGANLIQQARNPGGRPRRKTAEPKPEARTKTPRRGTKAYYQARLEIEHPELAAAVKSGEKSVNAAAIEAGLRKAPKAKAKTAPKREVEGTPEAVNAYLAEIRAAGRKTTQATA